jgi:DNA-binding MarR family transcriptional regulator
MVVADSLYLKILSIAFQAICIYNFSMRKYIELPLLTPMQLEIVNGLLLGDGSLHHIRNINGNWKFVTSQIEFDNKGVDKITYMEWIFKKFMPYSSKLTKSTCKNKIKHIDGKIVNFYGEGTNKQYSLTTHCHPNWTELSKKWYLWKDGELVLRKNKIIKIVPNNLVLTPLTICLWLMDDGSVDAKRGNIILSTNGFTINECEFLVTLLKKDMGILANVKTKVDGPVIRFGVESYKKLLSIIKPCIKWDCFKYKIDDSYDKIHQQGEYHSQSKLTEVQVKKIFEFYNNGVEQKEIAKQFNVSQPAISEIVTGKNWSYIGIGKPGRKFKKLSIDIKNKIIEYVKEGRKQKDIAKELGIDQSTVSKTLKNV